MDLEALQGSLLTLEKEILRLTNLASECCDPRQQDDYYRFAQDLQREARGVRRQIAAIFDHSDDSTPGRRGGSAPRSRAVSATPQ